MFGDGLEKEVIIRVLPRINQEAPSMFSVGGLKEYDFDRLDVWANARLKENFEKIPGVLQVATQGVEVNYMICVDPRYNLKWVMAEIEAVAKTEKPAKEEGKKFGSLTAFATNISWGIDFAEPDPKTKPRRKTPRKAPKAKK